MYAPIPPSTVIPHNSPKRPAPIELRSIPWLPCGLILSAGGSTHLLPGSPISSCEASGRRPMVVFKRTCGLPGCLLSLACFGGRVKSRQLCLHRLQLLSSSSFKSICSILPDSLFLPNIQVEEKPRFPRFPRFPHFSSNILVS